MLIPVENELPCCFCLGRRCTPELSPRVLPTVATPAGVSVAVGVICADDDDDPNVVAAAADEADFDAGANEVEAPCNYVIPSSVYNSIIVKFTNEI